MIFDIAMGAAIYASIGFIVVYLLGSYYKPFNQGQDMMLGETIKMLIVGAFLWPFFLMLLFYELFIEGKHIMRKPVIKYKGKK